VTVRKAVLQSRLAHLGRVIRDLERLRALPLPEREGNSLANLSLERALHVAAEAIFDIGHHLLAGRGLDVPAAYRDVLPALARAGIIKSSMMERLDGLAGLRNILVHDYVGVDQARLWNLLDERLDDLRAIHATLGQIPELNDGSGIP
jgi:uncharacterized protein YutE (UPF0331/DUF86 family)